MSPITDFRVGEDPNEPVDVEGHHVDGVWSVELMFRGEPDLRVVAQALSLASGTVMTKGLAQLSWDELAAMLPDPHGDESAR